MARNITGTYAAGITLTNAGDNPLTIASSANIANASGIGLQSSAAVNWYITNAANAKIGGNAFGVSIANAAIFTNGGGISASYSAGSGFSYSTVTHGFYVLSAALFLGGGGISNSAGGIISGGVDGAALGAAGTVINAGTIGAHATAVNSGGTTVGLGLGVALATGGAVTNVSSGVISASDYGVFADGAVGVTNQANATITGASRGIFAIDGSAAVNNQGMISGGRYGVIVQRGGGTVANQGTLSGGLAGVYFYGAAGAVTNQGTIQETIPVTNQTVAFGGVMLVSGGSVSNSASGVISSTSYGVVVTTAPGIVSNAGTIFSSRAVTNPNQPSNGNAAIALRAGGSITNSQGGVLAGEWIGVQSGIFGQASAAPPVTIDNSGTISAADGKGDGAALWIHGPGVIINRAGGVIEGQAANETIVGGPLTGLLNGGFGVVAYYQTTLINYGSIGGTSFAFTAARGSSTVGNRIEMAPGATFGGAVSGAYTSAQASLSTLELLSGASVGTVTGFGTHYQNFGNIAIDNGARWNLGGTVAAGTTIAFGGTGALTLTNPTTMQGAISGFAAGETVTLAGVAATGSSFSNGVLTLTEASGSVALNFPGNFTTADFTVANGSAGAAVSVVGPGLLNGLTSNQQLELIYIAYFNRAADDGGFTFWAQQNVVAQNSGQSAALALTNIANSFTPQPETIALYPFLANPGNLNTPAAQAGLTTFIGALYQNLFGHAPDAPGQAYWVGQITSGAVGLGAAALAIANGASGPDAIEVWNKIVVALDFTTRTGAAGLSGSATLPSSFLPAARSVLSGVDGTSQNDASVTAGMNATTTFVNSLTGAHAASVAMNTDAGSISSSNDAITISTSSSVIDPGTGNHTIQFLPGTSGDTLVLHAGGIDQISGFDPGTDVLDLRALLSEANVNLNGNIAALSNYLTITDQGSDALAAFTPGQGGGGTFAVLLGSGEVVTNLDELIARGAVRIT